MKNKTVVQKRKGGLEGLGFALCITYYTPDDYRRPTSFSVQKSFLHISKSSERNLIVFGKFTVSRTQTSVYLCAFLWIDAWGE